MLEMLGLLPYGRNDRLGFFCGLLKMLRLLPCDRNDRWVLEVLGLLPCGRNDRLSFLLWVVRGVGIAEIKSFLNPSAITDFHAALGQFLNYRTALREKEPERNLYLAVDIETYNNFFTLPFPQLQIQEFQLKLVVYDTEIEEIVRWVS